MIKALQRRVLLDALKDVRTAKAKAKIAWLLLAKPRIPFSTYKPQKPGDIGWKCEPVRNELRIKKEIECKRQ